VATSIPVLFSSLCAPFKNDRSIKLFSLTGKNGYDGAHTKNFIFKGAMCLCRYIDLERETRDLDFLLKDLQGSIENIHKHLGEVSALDINDGFSFDDTDVRLLEHMHMQYPGYSFSVIGRIGQTKTKVFIDIGVGDSVKPTEITMQLLATEKTPLFEKDIELWAYPAEVIFAEKLETSITRGNQNSRMKDYHDLICLIRNHERLGVHAPFEPHAHGFRANTSMTSSVCFP
jgi:predicted nucleotidyltransferase component of viral defense system